MQDIIGQHAGQVWTLLNEAGDLTPTAIAKKLGLKAPEVDRAIGWLAREDKLTIETTSKGTLKIRLAGD
jgi:Mn-dependent DtxR family transcriptional regulator